MATQILGALLASAGVLWFFVLGLKPGEFFSDANSVRLLLGAILFIGGLLVTAVGRLEAAVHEPPEFAGRTNWLSMLFMWLPILVAAALFSLWYFGAESDMLKRLRGEQPVIEAPQEAGEAELGAPGQLPAPDGEALPTAE